MFNLTGINNKADKKTISYRIDFSSLNGIDVKCNLNCSYCHHDYFTLSRPFEIAQTTGFVEAINLLDSIIEDYSRPRKIHLSGRAEPLVVRRPILFNEIKKLADNFPAYDLVMTTNGILLNEYAEELIEAGMKRFNVSMHNGINEKSVIVKGMQKVAKLGGKIAMNVMISKSVIENIEKLIEFAGKNNFKIKLFYELGISEKETELQLNSMNQRLRDLTDCNGLFNLSKNRLEFFHNGATIEVKQLETLSVRPDNCAICSYNDICKEGCWESIRITPWYIKPCGVKEENVYFFSENSPQKLKEKLIQGSKITLNRQYKKIGELS